MGARDKPGRHHDNGGIEHRLTVLEQLVAGIQFDLELQRAAWARRSEAFRNLELSVNTMNANQEAARDAEAVQYRRLELRIQVLTLVIAAATVVTPITVAALHLH